MIVGRAYGSSEAEPVSGRGSVMRTQRLAAAVLALGTGILGVSTAPAGEPPSPIRRAARGELAIDMRAGADDPNLVGIEALPGGRIGFQVKVPGQDAFKMIVESLPNDRLRIIDRDDRDLECERLTLNLHSDEPTRVDGRRQENVDELDEALITRDLLEMEVESAKGRLQRMDAVLWETRLQQVQGFSNGPHLGGTTTEQKKKILDEYHELLSEVRQDFVAKSKELGRVRRRVAELEGQLLISAAAPSPSSPSPPGDQFQWKDVERILDLVLMGVETWRNSSPPASPPSPSAVPDGGSSKDTERILELVRKGLETWKRSDPSAASPSPPLSPSPPASPPAPVDPELKDAERILDLILRGVETWQRR